jgi:hypothetical protein
MFKVHLLEPLHFKYCYRCGFTTLPIDGRCGRCNIVLAKRKLN